MTTTTAAAQVRDYLAAIEHALADLAPADRDELLDDLEDHLNEVLAEGEGPLEQRLGPPTQYAAELRASAGLDPAERSSANLLHRAVDAISANELWRRTAEHRVARATIEFLPQLRPAWWIVRAWLAVEFTAAFARWWRGYGDERTFALLPRFSGNHYLAILLLVVAIPISIQLGRRPRHGIRRVLVIAGNVLAAVMVVPTFASLGTQTYYAYAPAAQSAFPAGLVDNGRPISNIYPYDEQGRPLENVRLYDDAGQPLVVGDMSKEMGGGTVVYGAVDGAPVPAATAYPLDGASPSNEFPQPATTIVYGPDGAPTTASVPQPNIVVAPLPNSSASPSLTPSPSPTPSLTPSPSLTPTPTPAVPTATP